MKFNVYFYDAFRPSLKDLTKAEQGAVMSSLLELAEDPRTPGLNVHRVGDASTRCWSARVNDDIRLIFFWVTRRSFRRTWPITTRLTGGRRAGRWTCIRIPALPRS